AVRRGPPGPRTGAAARSALDRPDRHPRSGRRRTGPAPPAGSSQPPTPRRDSAYALACPRVARLLALNAACTYAFASSTPEPAPSTGTMLASLIATVWREVTATPPVRSSNSH